MSGSYIRQSLHDFRIGGSPDDPRTELETNANDPKSLQNLASIREDMGVPLHARLPLERRQKAAVGALAIATIFCLAATLWTWIQNDTEYWQVAELKTGQGDFELYEVMTDGSTTKLGTLGDRWTKQSPVPRKGTEYRVVRGEKSIQFVYSAAQQVSIEFGDGPAKEEPAWQKFVWIPPGSFKMGSPATEIGREENETLHDVTISRGFYLAATEVTQLQYQNLMGVNPSDFKKVGPDAPVEKVSWEDAKDFCEKLTKRERAAGRLRHDWAYRLPTEAEWEYACRAGSESAYSFGDDASKLDDYAWFGENNDGLTHPVATKMPNRWGLYDMHGNVLEWCHDWYDVDYYLKSPKSDPTGPVSGANRVVRGGCWFYDAGGCRSAVRYGDTPGLRFGHLGFRVAAVRVEPSQASPRDEGERAISFGGFEFIEILPGKFQMGSPETEQGLEDDEALHDVEITERYYMGRYEVTQQQWRQVMGMSLKQHSESTKESISAGEGDKLPMYNVNYEDAVNFCGKLTEQHRRAGILPERYVYKLPTEAQWEYACRAGSKSAYGFGNDASKLGEYAWFGDLGGSTHPVGSKKPNTWGLYDMHGNVDEWCRDWYDPEYYQKSPTSDPKGPVTGAVRVIRGGGWFSLAVLCRSANRYRGTPDNRVVYLGFRVAAVREEPRQASPRDEGERAISFGEFEFIEVLPGKFQMGSPETEQGRSKDETLHDVEITSSYYLGRYEVTQQQWRQVMGVSLKQHSETTKKSVLAGEGDKLPMYNVNYEDAVKFCDELTKQHRNAGILPNGYVYNLPTEAQWEYACRAGSKSVYSFGNGVNELGKHAWYGDLDGSTHPVGSKTPNNWGLYDMHGNVWEWCRDWYDPEYYQKSSTSDPNGPVTGADRVMRGGGWINFAEYCRSANRRRSTPVIRYDNLGFRVAAVRDDQK